MPPPKYEFDPENMASELSLVEFEIRRTRMRGIN